MLRVAYSKAHLRPAVRTREILNCVKINVCNFADKDIRAV